MFDTDVAVLEISTTGLYRMLCVLNSTSPVGWTDEQFLTALEARGSVL